MVTQDQLEQALVDFITECESYYGKDYKCDGCRYVDLCNRVLLWESRQPRDIEVCKKG